MRISGGNSIANVTSVTPGGAGVTQAFNVASLSGIATPTEATAYSVAQQLITTSWNIIFAIVMVVWAFGWTGGRTLVCDVVRRREGEGRGAEGGSRRKEGSEARGEGAVRACVEPGRDRPEGTAWDGSTPSSRWSRWPRCSRRRRSRSRSSRSSSATARCGRACWFYIGALTATLGVGVVAAFVLGDAAASSDPSSPEDVGRDRRHRRGAAAARLRGRRVGATARGSRAKTEAMMERMGKVA